MKALLDLLTALFSREWPMVKDNPLPFLVTFVLGVILTALFYGERMSTYEQRIHAYQERVGEAPKETVYKGVANATLRLEATQIASRLRDFQQKDTQEQNKLLLRFFNQTSGDPPKKLPVEEWNRINQQYRDESSAHIQQRNLKFHKELISNIRAVRDEMLTRLPPDRAEQFKNNIAAVTLESGLLAGIYPIGELATDLEEISGLLPSQQEWWLLQRWQDDVFTVGVLMFLYYWALRQWAKHRKEKSHFTTSPPSDTA